MIQKPQRRAVDKNRQSCFHDDEVSSNLIDCSDRGAVLGNKISFSDNELNAIRANLTAQAPKKWEGKSIEQVKASLSTMEALSQLKVPELNVLIDMTRTHQHKRILKSLNKSKKVACLSQLLGVAGTVPKDSRPKQKKHRVRHVSSLKSITFTCVKKLPKVLLCAAKAAADYPNQLREWQCASTVPESLAFDDMSMPIFSHPEVHPDTGELMCKMLDGDHLLVNLRSKVCRDGLKGISTDAWVQVATQTGAIPRALVLDLIDRQNNGHAQRTFSSEVEKAMRDLGFSQEADFCHIIRQWYQAEDDKSIPAVERARRRLALHRYLLCGVSFDVFPTHGAYIKGMPQVMFEGFLQSIESHIFMYALCASGTYNQRTLTTLENETFFGVLSDMEPTSLGCPKASSVGRLMATVQEVKYARQNPENR